MFSPNLNVSSLIREDNNYISTAVEINYKGNLSSKFNVLINCNTSSHGYFKCSLIPQTKDKTKTANGCCHFSQGHKHNKLHKDKISRICVMFGFALLNFMLFRGRKK